MPRLKVWIVPVVLFFSAVACLSDAATPAPATNGPEPNNTVPSPTAVPATDAPSGGSATVVQPTSQPSQVGQPDLANAQVSVQPFLSGFDQPVDYVSPKDGSGRMFVVSRLGKIFIVKNGQVLPEPFLDISNKVTTGYQEQGLLGLAFHPQYSQNGYFFIYYNDAKGDIAISRMKVSSDPDKADPNSEQFVLQYHKPALNHNGGNLLFGPDGDLYMGTGDGGGGGDTFHNGQNPGSVLAKLLRINVDTVPYTIPPDNPFVGKSGFRPEIWAWGLRNPWRFSFDRQTGDLYIADVGQDLFEEIDVQPAGKGGQDYGWPIMEGMHCYNSDSCSSDGLTLPVAEYTHDNGCAVTGGYVYRGSKYPALDGIYFFSDYCSGNLWGMARAADGTWQTRLIMKTGAQVSSFGEDDAGELYVVDLGGRILKLVGGS